MAHLFRTPKMTRDAAGKRIPLLDAKGKPVFHSHWSARIMLHDGKRKAVKLSARTEAEARKQAAALESRQLEYKNGLRAAPTSADRAAQRPIVDVIAEYFDYGTTQGGRGGRPWSATHSRDKATYLNYWVSRLGFVTLADATDCLPDVEKGLRELAVTGLPDSRPGTRKKNGLSGKTLKGIGEALKAFFKWSVDRNYLKANPLSAWKYGNTKPKTIRRAMSLAELRALLDASPTYFRILVETALCSGLRKGELRALTPHHLDVDKATLRVDAEIDKGRKERFQAIPRWLVAKLADYAASGEAARLYAKHFSRKDRTATGIPENPLLFVPGHVARLIAEVAQKAGVEQYTDAGKIDFHALRTAYINLLLDSGTDAKTVQEMARHTTAHLTMNVYGRAKAERMADAAEIVGKVVTPTPFCQSTANPIKAIRATCRKIAACNVRLAGSTPVSSTIFQRGPFDENVEGLSPYKGYGYVSQGAVRP